MASDQGHEHHDDTHHAILHIKDAYFFDCPKSWAVSKRVNIEDFPDVWVRLDGEYQLWEAKNLHANVETFLGTHKEFPTWEHLKKDYLTWRSHHNYGKPLDVFLEEKLAEDLAGFKAWSAEEGNESKSFEQYLEESHSHYAWFSGPVHSAHAGAWESAKAKEDRVAEYKKEDGHDWSSEKVAAYNKHLSGKILIPQPFGKLRNLHEADSGFCVSKFMIIEVVVALMMLALFTWLGRRISTGTAPKGRLWNLMESFLVFIREEIAKPALGHDAEKYVPMLWTIFMFVLGCNLCGMLPFVGAPTSAFAVTSALAIVTFGIGFFGGVLKFGPLGFFTNQVPHMDLPAPIAIIIKPMLLVLELVGLLIKHFVLAVRLLANMVAGHLVLLGVMALAVAMGREMVAGNAAQWQWGMVAFASVVGSALFSLLELFVAFLQSYIFTFLSALFISASTHHH